MSTPAPAYTNQEIGDFLGNIELHLLHIKNFWQHYLEKGDANAKAEVIDCITHIQQILNSIESSIGMTLPSTPLSDTEIVTFGIMPH